MADKMVVTIGRTFGSGGHDIGKALAEALGFSFYDKEILTVAAQQSGLSQELFESNDEKPTSSLLYSLSMNPYGGMGITGGPDTLPIPHKLFLAQFEAIRKVADQENCVIVGRCADYALRSRKNCLNLFIHAPMEYRIPQIQSRYGISVQEAKDRINKTDKKRASYYNSYSDRKWGALGTYHLSVDSSVLGPEETVELLKGFAQMFWKRRSSQQNPG